MAVKRRLRLLIERMLGVQVVPSGFQVVPPGHVALLFEQEHLRRLLADFEVDCVFDVGANAGQYATMLRTKANYHGTIISYEPIPELARQLRALSRADSGWFIEESALSASEGQVAFKVYASNQFSSIHAVTAAATQQFSRAVQLERRIEVRTTTLARELPRQQAKLGFHRPFLKMDTQGHDLAVASGAGDRLREFVGLQSELAIVPLYLDSPTYQEALAFYQARGFELSAFVPNNLGHFPRLLEFDCIMLRADLLRVA